MKRTMIVCSLLLLAGCVSDGNYNNTYRQPQPYNWGITQPPKTTTTYYNNTPVRQQGGPPPGCRKPVYNKGLGFWQCLDEVPTAR